MRISESRKYLFSKPCSGSRNSAHIETAVSRTIAKFIRILIVTSCVVVINSTLVQKSILSKLSFQVYDVLVIVKSFLGNDGLAWLLSETFELLRTLLLIIVSGFIIVSNLLTILLNVRALIFQART